MSPPTIDLSSSRRVHVIAAGGAGMSAIATLLIGQGHEVSGSDAVDSEALRRLGSRGVRTHVGHSPANLGGAEFVVRSTAVDDENVEVVEARNRAIPVLARIDLLSEIAKSQPFISVSGTHGKTTTTSMLTVALRGVGADPSFLIGAMVPALGGAGENRGGRHLVLEADESDGSFMAGPRAGALVTNIEPDHLEFWGSWESLLDGFKSFLVATPGPRIVCADDPAAARIAAQLTGDGFDVVTYGTSTGADYRIRDLSTDGLRSVFTLEISGVPFPVEIAVPGLHNATNAAGALAMVAELGFDLGEAAGALLAYTGVSRRFESRGQRAGIQFVDDYAHLPTEVRAALAAARSGGWKRVVATFQPHRYSRTQALVDEFADAFVDADLLVLTEIYAAGEKPRQGVDGRLVYETFMHKHPGRPVVWAPTLTDAASFLAGELRSGDICMSIGAGDVTTLTDLVTEQLG